MRAMADTVDVRALAWGFVGEGRSQDDTPRGYLIFATPRQIHQIPAPSSPDHDPAHPASQPPVGRLFSWS